MYHKALCLQLLVSQFYSTHIQHGPAYNRGVAGVMAGESLNIGALEEVGGMLQGGKLRNAILRDG